MFSWGIERDHWHEMVKNNHIFTLDFILHFWLDWVCQVYYFCLNETRDPEYLIKDQFVALIVMIRQEECETLCKISYLLYNLKNVKNSN